MSLFEMQRFSQRGLVTETVLSDFFAILFSLFIVYKLVIPATTSYLRLHRLWQQVGGPKRHWLYGHLDKYQFNAEGLKNSVRRCKDFPKMACQWLGPAFAVVHLYHPDVVQAVLSKSYPKAIGYRITLGRLMRDGLVTSSGAIWKRHRKMLTAVFHFDIIKSHISVFNDSVHRMMDYLDSSIESSSPCDITIPINSLTYENTMRCVFSQRELQWGDSSFSDCIRKLNYLCMSRLNNPLYFSDFVYQLTPTCRKFDEMLAKVYNMLQNIMTERKAELKNKALDGVESSSETFSKGKKKFVDFLDILLQSSDDKGKFTDDEVMDEVVTFFAAGQETVANSLSWTLYNLAQHKEWQDKCREEILEIIGENETVECNEESRMTTLTMCIKESMRLYPILHVVARELTEDVQLKKAGVTLEKGIMANVNIYTLHHNPDVWKDPERFDPNRFTPDNSSKRSPFAFIPFAAGPRNCIGQNFAMHQMRVTLSHVLRRFEFYTDSSCAEPEIYPCITLQIKDGIQMKARRVEQ